MKILKYIFFLIILTSIPSFAQKPKVESNGYAVTIATKNLQKEKLILFMKYGTNGQMVISDSLTIKSNDQKVVFKKNQKQIDAIYFLKLASQKNEIALVLDNNTNASFSLEDKNIEVLSAELHRIPSIHKELNEEQTDEVLELIEGEKPSLLQRKKLGDRILKRIMDFVETFINGMAG